jgi:DNA-binding FadR family transcriptional regulator
LDAAQHRSRSSGHRGAYPRNGLHGQVVHDLGRRIVNGEFQEGEILPNESELLASLKVSRSVLRESMKVLAAKGLVEFKQRVGTRVRPRVAWRLLDPDVLDWLQVAKPDIALLRSLTEVRLILEPAAARLAADRATAQDLSAIEAAYLAMTQQVEDEPHYINADMDFHQAILHATENVLLEQIGTTIAAGLLLSRHVTVRRPGSSVEALPIHEAVLDAIRRRDPSAAERAMKTLVESAWRDVQVVLQDALTRAAQS